MTPTPQPETELPNIASLLSATYHFTMGRIIAELESAGFSDLSKTQLHLLSRVGQEGQTVKVLSERLHMARQIVWNLTHMLAENGYVTEQQDESGLVAGVRLAERGQNVMKVVEATQNDVEENWARALGEGSYTELRTKLVELFQLTTR